MLRYSCLFVCLICAAACHRATAPESAAVWQKVRVDFKNLDEQGRYGPANGKVSLNYEFCIPATAKAWRRVRKIDPTAQRHPQSKGRVGCGEQQWLVIGSTEQKNYRRVLYELASLPFVERIETVYWE
jgi:hypothetical protein